MNLGIDTDFAGFVVSGFAYGFGVWFLSRAVRFIYQIIGSRTGNVKPD